MKTTVELPDALFRQAKAVASARGTTLKLFFTEAIEEQLRRSSKGNGRVDNGDPPWMAGFGALADLSDETDRILKLIEEEFERVAPEDLP